MKALTALVLSALAVAVSVATPGAHAQGFSRADTARIDPLTTDVLWPGVGSGENLKPEVGGIATGEGVSQEECDSVANEISDEIQAALDAYEAGEVDGALAHLDHADTMESVAGDKGCAIVYPN